MSIPTSESNRLEIVRQLEQMDLEEKLNEQRQKEGKPPIKHGEAGGNKPIAKTPTASSKPLRSSKSIDQLNSGRNANGRTTPEIRRLSANKIVVGIAPNPQIKKVQSKIDSLSNTSYKSSGGKIKIESKKCEWNGKEVKSKIDSLSNTGFKPGSSSGIKKELKKVPISAPSEKSLSGGQRKPVVNGKKVFY